MENLHHINADTLKNWLDQEEVILIDVRELAEYKEESIPGARLACLSEFDSHAIAAQSGKKLVFYCRSGGRSTEACMRWLKSHQSEEAYNLVGGILAWKKQNYPLSQ